MLEKLYKVKGIDVNGFMIMQNTAYVTYTTKLVELFLTENRYSKERLNKLQIGLQKNKEQVTCKKYLMFNQLFKAILKVDKCKDKILRVTVRFYNQKEELCAQVQTEFYWFDYKNWKAVRPIKGIENLFVKGEVENLLDAS